jgi:type II secretory pathway component PulM
MALQEEDSMTDSRSTQVSLGCGTLILIALIVLIFSHGRNDGVLREVQNLDSAIRQLKTAVESQADEIKALRQTLEAMRPAPPRAEAEQKR